MMAIKFIQASNFRSFDELNLELGEFNVIVGANASGKSNFLQIFQFLKDIATKDINNAISLQGGVQYLRNINLSSCDELSLKVNFDFGNQGILHEKKGILFGIRFTSGEYNLVIKFKKSRTGYTILKEELKHDGLVFRLERTRDQSRKKEKRGGKGNYQEKEELGRVSVVQARKEGKLNFGFEKKGEFDLELQDFVPDFFKNFDIPESFSILGVPIFSPLIDRQFTPISIYDFDPKLPKKASPITGKSDLEEDGSNLAIVVQNIIENVEKKKKLINLLQDMIPTIKDVAIEKFADKSLLFKLREAYSRKHYLPASLISDGTINVIALIIALYFEKSKFVIIEEPERNIHPYLISKVVELMRDSSTEKQIIVTTHNPEIVKHAGIKSLYLITRDESGFSKINRPKDNNDVKVFLKNNIGVDELFVQNLLNL